MNKVIIECAELIKEYGLDEEVIINQLEASEIKEGSDFIITYSKDFRITLVGEMGKNDKMVVLTNIIKADAVEKMDNSDLYEFIKKQGHGN